MHKEITYSELKCFADCAAKWYYRYKEQLEPKEYIAVAREQGRQFHEVLAQLFEKRIPTIQNEDDAKMLAMATVLKENITLRGYKPKRIELEFKLFNYPNKGCDFVGKVDAYQDGVLFEWKTVSSLRGYVQQYDLQVFLYAYALRELKFNVEKIVIARCVRPQYKIKQNEELWEYEKRLEDTIKQNIEKYLYIHETQLTDADLRLAQEWIRDAVDWMQLCENTEEERLPELRNPTACWRYNRLCEYAPLCWARSKQEYENVLETSYVRREQKHAELDTVVEENLPF